MTVLVRDGQTSRDFAAQINLKVEQLAENYGTKLAFGWFNNWTGVLVHYTPWMPFPDDHNENVWTVVLMDCKQTDAHDPPTIGWRSTSNLWLLLDTVEEMVTDQLRRYAPEKVDAYVRNSLVSLLDELDPEGTNP